MATLNRFDENRREFARMRANPLEGLGRAVIEDDDVANTFAWEAGSDGQGTWCVATLYGSDEHFIEHAVIRTSEEHYFAAAGDGARYAESGDDRFRAGVTKTHALVAGHLAEHFCDLTGERRLRPNLEALVQLLFDGALHKIRTMAEHDGAEAAENVDVFVAVDVPKPGAFRPQSKNGIDHFLPLCPEAGNDSWVSKARTELLRHALGFRRPLRAAVDEVPDVVLLALGQLPRGSFLWWLVRAERFKFSRFLGHRRCRRSKHILNCWRGGTRQLVACV